MEKWFITTKKADFALIGNKFNISPVLARLIRNRDVVEMEDIERYLNGSIEDLYHPSLMKDMEKGADIIMNKIKEGKKIRIIGDYDIDGVNSTYILLRGLTRIGADADFEIPDRIADGYGINRKLIQNAYDEGVDSIVTCDNGIAAIDEINYAKELGMTVVVTDHHDIPYRENEDGSHMILESRADAIINPKQEQCKYPYKGLCGGAVAYKLIHYLYEKNGIDKDEIHQFIEFAAIATVGDVMDLTGENRIIVKEGLKRLQKTDNLGLQALIRATGLQAGRISAYHIGFVLGPCMNASGRLDTAKRALYLLQSSDKDEADKIAGDLKALNDSRKAMTLEGTNHAIQLVDNSDLQQDKVLVIYLENCHESLAGIIAGRIREKYNKPVIILTKAEEGVKGSGRSIEAYNMFEELVKCADLLSKFGGHPMAAGLSLPEENIVLLRRRLNEKTTLTDEDLVNKVSIDIPVPISYITEEFIQELELLEPFGKGNVKPVFAQKNIRILQARILGKNKNVLKMRIADEDNLEIEAMFFGNIQDFEKYIIDKFSQEEMTAVYQGRKNGVVLSVTYYPSINEYNGTKTLQIVIQNYQ